MASMNISLPKCPLMLPWVRPSFRSWRMAATLIVLGTAFPALAALGGTLDSISSDRSAMNATMRLTEVGAYSVYEIQSPTGTVVREYISPAGRVFGVAWQGPFIPDLRFILGSYFERYSVSAKTQRESHVGRRPLQIREPGLVVQTTGHMRAFWGRVYDPGLLPAGVGFNEIR